tara:strand:+ start:23839 stop:24123 length:285 start_codon:yes stop_codon:yes gene_type:complete
MQRIQYVYEDKIENLLDQYSQQLAHHEKIFHEKHKDLDPLTYSRLRENDPATSEILGVIARIYEANIPIALVITDEKAGPAGTGAPGPAGDIRH